MSLRKKLAEFGFESNEDYDFAVRTLLESESSSVRTAELVGAIARRKTAFAHALGLALAYPQRLYHDFTRPQIPEPPAPSRDEDDENIDTGDRRDAVPLNAFERILTEACAFSESSRTLLILDQLQACDFADQLRLFQFIQSGVWTERGGTVIAHRRNLLVLLISNEALYHSLQKCSFRIFTDASAGIFDFKPEDFGLGANTQALIDAFAALFDALHCQPTRGEFERILRDCEARVRTAEQLRICVFGRIENLDRDALYDPTLLPMIHRLLHELTELLGIEVVSLSADSPTYENSTLT